MAGSITNAFRTSLLTHIFQNADIANIGDAAGLQNSATAGSFYVSLMTTTPTDSTTGTEANYTGYARVAVARTSGGWTVTDNNVSNTGLITFGKDTVGTNVIEGFGIHTALTNGDLLFWGDLMSGGNPTTLTVTPGVTPEFAAGELDIYISYSA